LSGVDNKLVRKYLDRSPLTKVEREIMRLVYIDGQTLESIGIKIGRSKSTVSYHLTKGRKAFDEWLKYKEFAKKLKPEEIEKRISAIEAKMEEYKESLDSLLILAVQVGDERQKSCQFVSGENCTKRSLPPREMICALCTEYIGKVPANDTTG